MYLQAEEAQIWFSVVSVDDGPFFRGVAIQFNSIAIDIVVSQSKIQAEFCIFLPEFVNITEVIMRAMPRQRVTVAFDN